MISGKRFTHPFSCYFVVLLLIACWGWSSTGSNLSQTTQENVIVIGTPHYFNEFSQWNTSRFDTAKWHSPLTATLYKRSISHDRTYQPYLAASMPSFSDDGLTLTVDLKSDLKFSSGNPLTAKDVVFTYQVILTPAITPNPFFLYSYEQFAGFFAENASIVADPSNDLRVSFTFTTDVWDFRVFHLGLLELNIIEKEKYSDLYNDCAINGNLSACQWDNPNGSFLSSAGPFMFDTSTENTSVELVKNPYFHDAEKVHTDRIIFQHYPKKTTAITALEQGELDFLDPDFDFIPTDIDDANLDLLAQYNNQEQFFFFNHQHPYWGTGDMIPDGNGISDDNRIQSKFVRQAMDHLLNRTYITQTILGGLAVPAGSTVPPLTTGHDPTILPREYSIERAKQLMEAAGFNYSTILDNNGDGDYADDGDTAFFNTTILTSEGNLERVAWAKYYAAELPKIGINATVLINVMEYFSRSYYYPNDTLIPPHSQGGYDMIATGMTTDYDWDHGVRYDSAMVCSSQIRLWGQCINVLNYDNSSFDVMHAQYLAENNDSKAIIILQEIQHLLHEDLHALSVYYQLDLLPAQKGLQGLDLAMFLDTILEWENVYYQTWIPEDALSTETPSTSLPPDGPSLPEIAVVGIIGIGVLIAIVIAIRSRQP